MGSSKLPATLPRVMQSLGLGARVFAFLLLGVLSLIYLFTYLGEADLGQISGYTIDAEFSNAGGLKPGSSVELAGVRVGQVAAIKLAGTRSLVTLRLRDGVTIQDDAIASILTKGLLGERYVTISPGGSDKLVPSGGKIRETESPLDIPGLLSAYVNSRQQQQNQQKKPTPPVHSPSPSK